jgi:hypothetical protein
LTPVSPRCSAALIAASFLALVRGCQGLALLPRPFEAGHDTVSDHGAFELHCAEGADLKQSSADFPIFAEAEAR